MKTLWTIIGVLVLIGIVYFVYQNMNKNKVATVAVNTNPVVTIPTPAIKRTIQVNNPYPQDYLNSFGNPELIRMNKAIIASKTYVFTCTKKNPDGTTTTTSGYSSNPSGNCALGFKETIIKSL